MVVRQKELEGSKGHVFTGIYTESERRVDRALTTLLQNAGYSRREAEYLVFTSHDLATLSRDSQSSADPQTFRHNATAISAFREKFLQPGTFGEYRQELLNNLDGEMERLRHSLLPPHETWPLRAVPRRTDR
jgi:hypothetical protein